MKLLAQKTDPDAKIPVREHPTDAGIDFFSLHPEMLIPGARKLISTGIKLSIPPGHVLFLKDKSGLATQSGIHIMAGVIDEDYRGEIKVLVINHGSGRFIFEKGMKLCQGVLLPVSTPNIEEVVELSTDTSRGENGFGSTGDGTIPKAEIAAKISVEENILHQIDDLRKEVESLLTENLQLKHELNAKQNIIDTQYISSEIGA